MLLLFRRRCQRHQQVEGRMQNMFKLVPEMTQTEHFVYFACVTDDVRKVRNLYIGHCNYIVCAHYHFGLFLFVFFFLSFSLLLPLLFVLVIVALLMFQPLLVLLLQLLLILPLSQLTCTRLITTNLSLIRFTTVFVTNSKHSNLTKHVNVRSVLCSFCVLFLFHIVSWFLFLIVKLFYKAIVISNNVTLVTFVIFLDVSYGKIKDRCVFLSFCATHILYCLWWWWRW